MISYSNRSAAVSLLAATILALAAVPRVEAQTGRVRRNAGAMQRGGRGYQNGMANQGNMAVASSLHSTLQVLAQVDHDYQGHRVLAIRQIHAAIRHLVPAARGGQQNHIGPSVANGGGTNGNGNGVAATRGKAGKNRMPQATSDQQLQQALQSLTAIHGQIMSGGSTPNHARAATAVQNAIRELNIALNIR